MYLKFFCLQLIVASCTGSINMIRDYFIYKKVTRVSGFCCGDCGNDYDVVKVFNDVGISVTAKPIGSNVDVPRFLHTEYWNLGVFLDLRCREADNNTIKIFLETSDNRMFDHLHQWLILANNISDVVEVLNEDTFTIITDFAVAIPTDDHFVLYDLYNHCKHCGSLLNITDLGTWTKSDGINITLQGNKFSRRYNYNGMNVTVAGYILARPKGQNLASYLREQNIQRRDNWAKFGYSVLAHAAEMFNFTLQEAEMNHWSKNDSSGPLFGGFKNSIFDLGYYPSILTHRRLNLGDVILQVWPARSCFLFRTVPSTKFDMTIIFRPFERHVWYVLFLVTPITIIVLWVNLRSEKIYKSDCGTTALIVIAALCQQGLPGLSKKFACRIALFHTLLFGLLVYNCYSASVVSSRLNVVLNKMNDSLYSLAESKIKLSSQREIFLNLLLNTPLEEYQYFRRHWEEIPEEQKYRSLDEGVESITKPGFAYHTDPYEAYPVIERKFTKQMICELTEVNWLRPAMLALWSAKKKNFQEITKIGLIKMYTSGVRQRQLKRWSSRTPYCDKNRKNVSSVTFRESIPITFIFLAGVILSVAICFLEHIVFNMLQSQSAKVVPVKRTGSLSGCVLVKKLRSYGRYCNEKKNVPLKMKIC